MAIGIGSDHQLRRHSKDEGCNGNIAEERVDQPVNHPDVFVCYYYRLPGGEASVALKNKSELMSTLVSIGIDGFTTTN